MFYLFIFGRSDFIIIFMEKKNIKNRFYYLSDEFYV